MGSIDDRLECQDSHGRWRRDGGSVMITGTIAVTIGNRSRKKTTDRGIGSPGPDPVGQPAGEVRIHSPLGEPGGSEQPSPTATARRVRHGHTTRREEKSMTCPAGAGSGTPCSCSPAERGQGTLDPAPACRTVGTHPPVPFTAARGHLLPFTPRRSAVRSSRRDCRPGFLHRPVR